MVINIKLTFIKVFIIGYSMSSLLSFNHFSKNNYNEILIIAHGLFGSKTNWMSTAKFLSENLHFEIIVVDLRNHGSSFWSDCHDYFCIAEDLIKLTESFSKSVNLLGHSMGGKAAMVHLFLGQVLKLVILT